MTIFQIKMRCPDMKVQADAESIHAALRSSPGFNRVDFDLPNHTIIVTTANQDGGSNAILSVSNAGFPPEETEVLSEGDFPG